MRRGRDGGSPGAAVDANAKESNEQNGPLQETQVSASTILIRLLFSSVIVILAFGFSITLIKKEPEKVLYNIADAATESPTASPYLEDTTTNRQFLQSGGLNSNSHSESINYDNNNPEAHVYDLVVYGATPSGCAAAIAAGEMNMTVLLVEPTAHVGGMLTEGGIGLRDCGYKKTGTCNHDPRNSQVRWEMLNAKHYGLSNQTRIRQPDNYVGEDSLLKLLNGAGVEIWLNANFIEGSTGLIKHRRKIQSLRLENGKVVHGKYFVDASYDGELLKAANVSYTFGREASVTYDEKWAGTTQNSAAKFPVPVDPFEANGTSLLKYIQDGPDPRAHVGQRDENVMSYSYRVCLTKDPENKVPITPPEGYNPNDFELARRLVLAELKHGKRLSEPWGYLHYMEYEKIGGFMKYDACCGFSAFGIDNPALSAGYSAASRAGKSRIASEHRYFVQGLMWFWQNDTSVPESHREHHKKFGLCKDEWPDNGHFPRQLYVREAIRMIGDKVFTQNDRTTDCREDSIAVATWFFDIHDVQRVAVKNDQDVWTAFNEGCVGRKDSVIPFDLPYWVILPKKNEITNLAVTNCPSVSHVAFSAIREEPTLWALGMAAGIAASIAVAENLESYHSVDIVALRAEIDKQGGRYHFPSNKDCVPELNVKAE